MKSNDIKYRNLILICICLVGFASCKKDFLEAKPSTSLLLLRSITDYQFLLNNTTVFNQTGSLPFASTDEIDVPDYATYLSFEAQTTRNSYIWSKDLYGSDLKIEDWNRPYKAIFFSNSVLEALPNDEQVGSSEWRRTKGWALFGRAFAYYDLVGNFCKPYDSQTAQSDKGLPLRLKPGIDDLLPRSNLKDTYALILSDLIQSKELLTNDLSVNFRNEPSKAAVFALLARIHLSMRDYNKAESYADSCMLIYKKLIDYNTVTANVTTPFNFFNDETIYQSTQINGYNEVITTTTGQYTIRTELLDSYDDNDLRRTVFFVTHANGRVYKRRGYSGRANHFTGLATNEIYLIKAECAARRSNVTIALKYLNDLLINRYKTDSFIPRVGTIPAEVLQIVLTERKKELVRTGLRWSDLKRYNKEGANIKLTRVLNGVTYTLEPNDPRYIYPIPNDEIAYSGIEQNAR
ncbi:RagB/SusD family nutrient uptake outer membrane protein [Pedobacter nyackensis]|uniref:SusD family protein n=1 Tax=Pedobacter nyackensis TaxID=475255 RepID=A0A1W2A2L4_9SPHI|nr:RagB/SusD family nutrient uptake outer membrane protein [Pedobacter nyackensis]SMC54866.1 SusD family protein [Pedobacter nyackensis]